MTRSQLGAALVAMVVAWIATPPAMAEDLLTVTASPHASIEPAWVRLVVRVERHEANRAIVITVDSAGLFRSSLIPLTGESAPAVHVFDLKSLPEGRYTVTVALRRSDDTTTTATDRFSVLR